MRERPNLVGALLYEAQEEVKAAAGTPRGCRNLRKWRKLVSVVRRRNRAVYLAYTDRRE
jgi:hypothetical protein